MSGFSASYLEIDELELVHFLLNAAGQSNRDQINPQDLLDFLKLQCIQVDFVREFSGLGPSLLASPPRALISFHDRLIATEHSLEPTRMRFSVLHEIGHYVLPNHQNAFYICDKRAMGFNTPWTFEKEANQFAANLLFLADRFELEANSHSISPHTVKKLAEQFGASFEATARRIAERTYRDCMFVSFAEDNLHAINSDFEKTWKVRYCIASPSFSHKYFSSFTRAVVSPEIAQQVCCVQDISQSVTELVQIQLPGRSSQHFRAEYFFNSFNIFCFLTPANFA
jgi:Zn-dependent peptidase ImmA (M78 family)